MKIQQSIQIVFEDKPLIKIFYNDGTSDVFAVRPTQLLTLLQQTLDVYLQSIKRKP